MITRRLPNFLAAALVGVLAFTTTVAHAAAALPKPWFDKTWRPGEIELVK